MAGPSKSEILAMFAELDGKPDKHGYGDPFQYPVYEWLCDREQECGDSLLKPLQHAINETPHKHAAESGILFLGQMPGSVQYLANIVVSHNNKRYRSTAVESLEMLGALETLRGIYNDVPVEDREYVGMMMILMECDALGAYGPLVWSVLHGNPPSKQWDESKDKLGEAKTRETVIMVRDHPQLPERIKPTVNKTCSELLHDG